MPRVSQRVWLVLGVGEGLRVMEEIWVRWVRVMKMLRREAGLRR